jgi:hypothetical protein
MADWKTRLAVSFKDPDTKQQVDIAPIDSFTPSFSLNAEVLHSLAKTHIGVIYSPQSMTFSMTVKAIGDIAARLTKLALAGTHFDITLQAATDTDDWSFESIVMTECVITSATPTAATISGAPSATFSGFSLAAAATPHQGKSSTLPFPVPKNG